MVTFNFQYYLSCLFSHLHRCKSSWKHFLITRLSCESLPRRSKVPPCPLPSITALTQTNNFLKSTCVSWQFHSMVSQHTGAFLPLPRSCHAGPLSLPPLNRHLRHVGGAHRAGGAADLRPHTGPPREQPTGEHGFA